MKEQGVCVICRKNKQDYKGSRWGYRKVCKKCKLLGKSNIKEVCSRCEFIPEHPCQMDVDHINEDSSNNSPDNLQVLCANCHRLKTWENNNVHRKISQII